LPAKGIEIISHTEIQLVTLLQILKFGRAGHRKLASSLASCNFSVSFTLRRRVQSKLLHRVIWKSIIATPAIFYRRMLLFVHYFLEFEIHFSIIDILIFQWMVSVYLFKLDWEYCD
jgi:hypothetical protein